MLPLPKAVSSVHLDQFVLGELGPAGVDVVNDFAEMIDIAFGIEGVGRHFEGNAVLPGDLLCKDGEGCRHGKPHLGADLLHTSFQVRIHSKIHIDCVCHSDTPPL